MLSEDFKNMYNEQLTFWGYHILLENQLPRALNWMEFHLASEYNEPLGNGAWECFSCAEI